jgi:proteasome lid subunit RPN8/RPN11
MSLSSDTPCEVWRPSACAFAVETSSVVLDQLRREAEAGLNAPRGEHEIGGVLFGIRKPDCIRIVASRPLKCEHAMGPGFVLSAKDEDRLARLISAYATEAALAGLDALGWYHSHIHSKILLSECDLRIHERFFPSPFQVALVLRPADDRPTRAGFFVKESSGAMRKDSSYEEFTIESTAPAGVQQIEAGARGVASEQVGANGELRRRSQRTCPKCRGKRLRRSHHMNPLERLLAFVNIHPYRCGECLSRFWKHDSVGPSEQLRRRSRRRPEETRRKWMRTRREILLWGGGILGFLVFVRYLVRDTGPKEDQP